MRVGIAVMCAVCGDMKQPRGRSAPPGVPYCTYECDGYNTSPHVGSLWPGESEQDFGYQVSPDGTRDANEEEPTHG